MSRGNRGAVADQADWRGPDLAARDDWLRPINANQIAEISRALEIFEASGKSIGQMEKTLLKEYPRYDRWKAMAQ